MGADIGSTFTIFIETGFHAGTVQRLAPGMYTLGSELDADIVLSDSDVKPIHLVLEFDQGGVRLEPLQGGIAIQGESAVLEPGDERYAHAPLTFSIGETAINVTAPADAMKSRRRTRVLVGVAAVAIAAVLGIQVSGAFNAPDLDGPAVKADLETETPQLGGPSPGEGTSSRTINALEEQRQLASTSEELALTLPEVTLDQAAAELHEQLAARELSEIDVRTSGDRIMVRGEAELERMADWQEVRIWFDGAYGREFLLDASVEPAKAVEPPKLAIEAVWSGEKPYLVAGGQRFFVGHQIGEGWSIARIAADEIVFKRGDKSFSLAL
jgi:hypothetical protein